MTELRHVGSRRPDQRGRTGWVRSSPGSSLENGELPNSSCYVVPQNVAISFAISDLEVTVIRTEPAVQNLRDLNLAIAEVKTSGGFLPSVSCVAVDPNANTRLGHTVILFVRAARRLAPRDLADPLYGPMVYDAVSLNLGEIRAGGGSVQRILGPRFGPLTGDFVGFPSRGVCM